MTEETTEEGDATMADIDHTHPHTDEPFGEPFRRGSIPAADVEAGESTEEPTDETDRDAPEIRTDGGTPSADLERDERPTPTMAEVDHAGTAEVSTAFERGRVRTEETE